MFTNQAQQRSLLWHSTGRRPPSKLTRVCVQARKEGHGSIWSTNYSVLAEADKLDEAARRLRLTASTIAKQQVPLEQESRLVAERLALEQQDTLAAALKELQIATAAEQYAAAARLRDEAYAWLDGWWRLDDGKQQITRLLHVGRRSHGRWTGRIFSAVDFIHHDLGRQPDQAGANIYMENLLVDPRYGTPLFEVFVLPAQPNQQQGVNHSNQDRPSSTGDTIHSPENSSTSISEQSTVSSNRYSSLVVALQSANRAVNELLQIDPAARALSSSNDKNLEGVRPVNQRILLALQPGRASAVAIHAGDDQTLWMWTAVLPSQESATASSGTLHTQPCDNQLTVELVNTDQHAAKLTAGRVSERVRGMLVPSLSIDWHEVDLLRGPGSVERSAPNSLLFSRHSLPEDILITMISPGSSSSSSCSSSSSEDEQHDSSHSSGSCKKGYEGVLRLFCVKLQYLVKSAELAQASLPLQETAAAAVADSGAVVRDAEPNWMQVATRILHLLQRSHYHQQQQQEDPSMPDDVDNSSAISHSPLTGQAQVIADLLAAAAAGCAPPGGTVSELLQRVDVAEVSRPDGSTSSKFSSSQFEQSMQFKRIDESSVVLTFGGWEVQGVLPAGSDDSSLMSISSVTIWE